MRKITNEQRLRQLVGVVSPEEYKNSQLRIEVLGNMVRDGEHAKTIIDFADSALEQIREDTLAGLADPKNDPVKLQGMYQGALMFKTKIDAVIKNAEAKRKKLAEITQRKEG